MTEPELDDFLKREGIDPTEPIERILTNIVGEGDKRKGVVFLLTHERREELKLIQKDKQ